MKVCLIGNNLTSSILAYILSKKNFHVEIYYSKSMTYNYRSRTLGISDSNLKYLENYFKKIYQIANPINKIKVSIKNKKIDKKIVFDKYPKTLFNMVEYNKLKKLIKSKIKSNKKISFRTITKKNDLFKLTNKKDYKFIINCESSNLLTKKYLEVVINKNYFNKAYTTIIKHNKTKNNTANQIFTDYGPIAFLPLSSTYTSIVFSLEIHNQKNISEKKIVELIKKFNSFYEIQSFSLFESFNLKLKLPKKYFYKNILFFGDAIHSVHPLAGQGFNMTIRDIKKFIEIIDKKINLGLNIDKNIFIEFENKLKSQNALFSFGIDMIYELFKFNKNYVPKNISEKAINYINNNNNLKKLGIKIANEGIS